MLMGILAGLGAGAFWGIVFLVPEILTGYTAVDIAFGRYVVFGTISFLLLLFRWQQVQKILSWKIFGQTLLLSCLSFSV